MQVRGNKSGLHTDPTTPRTPYVEMSLEEMNTHRMSVTVAEMPFAASISAAAKQLFTAVP